jgi:5-hydroxyisourate hydrolase-like protein (transthyretin family)
MIPEHDQPSMITAQVIDTALGGSAALVPVLLDHFVTGDRWEEVGQGVTDADGLAENLGEPADTGIYRLTFDVAAYQADPFFPTIGVMFEVRDAQEDCHMALLLGQFSYSVSRA